MTDEIAYLIIVMSISIVYLLKRFVELKAELDLKLEEPKCKLCNHSLFDHIYGERYKECCKCDCKQKLNDLAKSCG